ncbi:hypothetical protein ACFV6D_02910 [Kitasatospora sp. NPDC059812]|uniref:hypothetical protein n=1 Tax=Kitasatospora sp. NPDC059812 TaxID=3346958 RepID=UPI003667F585
MGAALAIFPPAALVVLVGTSAAGVRSAVADLRLAGEENPAVVEMLSDVPARVAKLEDLEDEGPGADVWWSIAGLEAGPGPWWT